MHVARDSYYCTTETSLLYSLVSVRQDEARLHVGVGIPLLRDPDRSSHTTKRQVGNKNRNLHYRNHTFREWDPPSAPLSGCPASNNAPQSTHTATQTQNNHTRKIRYYFGSATHPTSTTVVELILHNTLHL